MKRRRFQHCITQSEAAISSGDLDGARAALVEARELCADSPVIAVLAARLDGHRDRTESGPRGVPLDLASESDEHEDDVENIPLGSRAAPAAPAPDVTLGHARYIPLGGRATERDNDRHASRLPWTIVLLALTGLAGFGLGQLSATRAFDDAAPDRSALPERGLVARAPVVPAPLQAPPPSPPPQPDDPRPAGQSGSAAPPVSAVATGGVGVEESRSPVAGGGAAFATDEEEIRAALKRYEQAYNRLDAKTLGPRLLNVDQSDLTSEVDLSLSGRISLGACDVALAGEGGVATCAGITVSDARHGGEPQRAQRQWSFDLRKGPDGWRMERVKVE